MWLGLAIAPCKHSAKLSRHFKIAELKGGSLLADGEVIPFDLLSLTLEELWTIHDYVRRHDKLGEEWEPDFMTDVMTAILKAQENPAHQAGLLCSVGELWQIDRQIPSALMVGTQPVGRNLLVKVMQLIVKMQGGKEDGNANTGKDSGYNTGQGTSRGPDTAATPR